MKISYSLIFTLTCLLAQEISGQQKEKSKRDKKTSVRTSRQLNNNADQMVQNILRWIQDVYGNQGRRSRSFMFAQDFEPPYYFASSRIDRNAFRQGSLREYLPPTPGEKPRPFTSRPSTNGAGIDDEGNFVDSGYPPAGFTPQPPFTIITNPATGGITGIGTSGIPGEGVSGAEGTYYPTQAPGRPAYTPTPYPERTQPPEVTEGPGYQTPGPGYQTPGPGYQTTGPGYQTPGPGYQTPGPEETPGQTIETPGVTPGYSSGEAQGYPTSSPSGFSGYPSGRPTEPNGYPSPGETRYPTFPTSSPSGFTGYPSGSPPGVTGFPTGYSTGRPTPAETQRPSEGATSPSPEITGGTGYPLPGFPTGPPTGYPSGRPSTEPEYTSAPAGYPTGSAGFPTARPTGYPTGTPTTGNVGFPTAPPTGYPTARPTGYPTARPTGYPTGRPTGYPTARPTGYPTARPTEYPDETPTTGGSGFPTAQPTEYPSGEPGFPTSKPPVDNGYPTGPPSEAPEYPTGPPSEIPGYQTGPPGETPSPSERPSGFPTVRPPGLKTTEIPTEGPPTGGSPGEETPKPTGPPGEGERTVPPLTDDDLKHPPHIHALDVQCAKDMMTINIEFNREFNGVIYSKGYYNMPECRYVNENSGQTKYTFTVNLNMCGTDFVNAFDTEGQSYLENILVLQNEVGIQEVWDTVRSVRCLWEGNLKEQLSVTLMVGMLSQEIVTFSGDTAMAKLDVLVGRGPFGQPASGLVKIGEPMTLVVSVSGDPGFDVQVKDCRATDSSGTNTVPLTDDNGCILKPKLFGSFQKTRNTGETGASIIAYAYFNAFKFPDVMDIMIECNIELCKTDCEMCPDTNLQLEPAKRRKRDLYSQNETLHDSLKMAKHLRVVLPEDLASATEFLHEGVCMSTQSFVYTSSTLLSLLTASCLLSAYLWLKTQKLSFKH